MDAHCSNTTKDGAVQTAYEKKLVWFEKWNEKKQDQMREKEARRGRSVVVWLQYPSFGYLGSDHCSRVSLTNSGNSQYQLLL